MKVILLDRLYQRKKPRKDWPIRWAAAAAFVKNEGVVTIKDKQGRTTNLLAAKKNSPIWKALSKGIGGFKDAIGSGKPPFAYGSGMGCKVVEYEEKEAKKEAYEEVKKKVESEVKKILPNKETTITINL